MKRYLTGYQQFFHSYNGEGYFQVNLIFLNQTVHLFIRISTASFNVVPFLPVSPRLGTNEFRNNRRRTSCLQFDFIPYEIVVLTHNFSYSEWIDNTLLLLNQILKI